MRNITANQLELQEKGARFVLRAGLHQAPRFHPLFHRMEEGWGEEARFPCLARGLVFPSASVRWLERAGKTCRAYSNKTLKAFETERSGTLTVDYVA